MAKTKQNSYTLQLFLIVFIALCLNFAPFIFNILWGNHDWGPLLGGSGLKSGFLEGRITQYIVPCLLTTGKILPIFNTIFAFIAYSLALILLANIFYKIKLPFFPRLLILLASATLPFITEILFFQFISLSLLSWPLFVVLSLLFAELAQKAHFLKYSLISSLFLFIAIGGYPPSISLFITACCCKLLSENIKNFKEIQKLFYVYLPHLISLIIASISLKFTFSYLKSHHIMRDFYNTSEAPLSEILQKIPHTLKISLESMLLPQPFFPPIFKILTFVTFIYFVICYLNKSKTKQMLIIKSFLIIITLMALKLSSWIIHEESTNYFAINDTSDFMVRADFYAYPCFLLFIMSYLFQNSSKKTKNFIFCTCIALIFINLNQNLSYSKTMLLGLKTEITLFDHVITKIYEHPKFISYNPYTIVQTGEISTRKKYYTPSILASQGFYTYNTPFTRFWYAHEYYNFYADDIYIRGGNSINTSQMSPDMINFFVNDLTSWPNKKSIYLDKDYIVIGLTKQGVFNIKKQFNSLSERNTQ